MKVLVKKKQNTRTYRGPFQLVWRRGSCLVLWAGHVEGSQVEWCWPCLDLQGHTNRKREREKDEQWLNGSTVNTSTAINYFLVKISKQGRPLKGGFRKFLFKLNICCTLQRYFFFFIQRSRQLSYWQFKCYSVRVWFPPVLHRGTQQHAVKA